LQYNTHRGAKNLFRRVEAGESIVHNIRDLDDLDGGNKNKAASHSRKRLARKPGRLNPISTERVRCMTLTRRYRARYCAYSAILVFDVIMFEQRSSTGSASEETMFANSFRQTLLQRSSGQEQGN
jgi:hypothetical protein